MAKDDVSLKVFGRKALASESLSCVILGQHEDVLKEWKRAKLLTRLLRRRRTTIRLDEVVDEMRLTELPGSEADLPGIQELADGVTDMAPVPTEEELKPVFNDEDPAALSHLRGNVMTC